MALLVLLNNFMHDFSAAGWLFGSVILWALLRKAEPDSKNEPILIDILKLDMFLMRLSLVGIVVFGLVRTLAYKTYEWNPQAGDGQIDLLIIKHILLTFVFAYGVWFYFKAKKLIKRDMNGKAE